MIWSQGRERKKIEKKERKTGERRGREKTEEIKTHFASNGNLNGRLTIA